jgi:aminoglycoside phosphotransferase family enzyme/predicted kinase
MERIGQATLIRGLRDASAYPHPVGAVELIETHISVVLLAGDFAYKLKKPVDLGFLDFSTLARRQFFCQEELRLNRRLAPALYLEVVPITGPVDQPRIDGGGQVLEYAVKMRRFSQQALLTERPPDAAIIDAIVRRVASFHAGLPPAPPDTPFGAAESVVETMRENFAQVRAGVVDAPVLAAVNRLERWTELWFSRLRRRLEQRRREGFIRECHGDLHRGNIAVLDAEPMIFDCIEFSQRLRWIDTMSEFAFFVMDLREAGQSALARRALNRYLELSGDYRGLALLRFYQVYRAMVRAKVIAIRLAQGRLQRGERAAACVELRGYLRLCRTIAVRPRPRLIIACGPSGSGKTWLANALREHLPLIHIRSDVERKRLFGLSPDARTASAPRAGIYNAEGVQRTYVRLVELARDILGNRYSVLVDATFLKAAQRKPFQRLAAELGCRFTILALDAPEAILRRRVSERMALAIDASEAGLAVLDLQLATRERLQENERPNAIYLNTAEPLRLDALLQALAGA